MNKQENKAKKESAKENVNENAKAVVAENAGENVEAKEEKNKTDEATGAANKDNISDGTLDVKKLKEENDSLNEQLLRRMAEFDNFRKRTQKEKEEMLVYSKGLFVKDMLAVLDNFERALLVDSADCEYKKGMEMIFNQFIQVLTKLDVTEIEAYNLPFDPEFHNAISQVENAEFGENTVCQVLQKGYKIGEKVVRHAMVVVANP